MREYATEAIVLASEPNGDLDGRVSLFTRQFGKLVARAKSIRKVTSKLAAHLQPGNAVRVRLVEKNGLQVVDALKSGKAEIAPPDLYFLNRLLPEAEPEQELWRMLHGGFAWQRALAILGWDPEHTACAVCGRGRPVAFAVATQEFFCGGCLSAEAFAKADALKLGRDEVLYTQ